MNAKEDIISNRTLFPQAKTNSPAKPASTTITVLIYYQLATSHLCISCCACSDKHTDEPNSVPPLVATLGPPLPLGFALPLAVLLPFKVGSVMLIFPPPEAPFILSIPVPTSIEVVILLILVIAVTVGSMGIVTEGIVVAIEETMASIIDSETVGTVVAETEGTIGMLVPISGRRSSVAGGRTARARGGAVGGC